MMCGMLFDFNSQGHILSICMGEEGIFPQIFFFLYCIYLFFLLLRHLSFSGRRTPFNRAGMGSPGKGFCKPNEICIYCIELCEGNFYNRLSSAILNGRKPARKNLS